MAKRPSLAETMKGFAAAPAARLEPEQQREAQQESGPRKFHAATREGLKKVTAGVEPPTHKQLKRLALDQDKSVEDLLREAIADLLAKYE